VRTLHLAHTSASSGGEIALLRLLGALDRDAVDSVLVCAEDGRLVEDARRHGVPTLVEPLPPAIRDRRRQQAGQVSTLALVPSLVAYAARVARVARAHRADAIHTNSLKALVYGLLAGRLAGIPVVAHLRDDLSQLNAGPAGTAVRSSLRRLPAVVVGCSSYVLAVAGVDASRARVVYTGVPRAELADGIAPRSGPPVVGMVARVSPWKGQDLFLRAAARVAVRRPDVRFRIIGAPLFGEEPYLREIERLAARRPLAGRVELTGFVPDPRTAYDQLTVAVAASVLPEPFGNVIVEAMARGLPVVAPAEGGPTEIITSGVDGLLIPPRDPAALARAILSLLDDPSRTVALAGEALRTVETRFTLESSARRFTEILREVAA